MVVKILYIKIHGLKLNWCSFEGLYLSILQKWEETKYSIQGAKTLQTRNAEWGKHDKLEFDILNTENSRTGQKYKEEKNIQELDGQKKNKWKLDKQYSS